MNTIPTIDQSDYQKVKIGSVLKAKVEHYLEHRDRLKSPTWEESITLKPGEIITYVNLEQHPYWESCVLLQVLYDCNILYLAIQKNHFYGVLLEEFELITQ